MVHPTILVNLHKEHRRLPELTCTFNLFQAIQAECGVPSDVGTEECWPEYCLCKHVVDMVSNVDIKEEQLRSRRI